MTGKPWYRRFRVSLRVLMLIVLVFGVWLGRQIHLARQQRDAVDAVKKHGGWVHYDYEIVNGTPVAGRQPWWPTWLRRRLGDEFFRDVASASFVYDDVGGTRHDNIDRRACDDDLALLSTQTGLKTILMQDAQATDEGLAHLKGLTGLEDLYI
jgi:hypothetical protein